MVIDSIYIQTIVTEPTLQQYNEFKAQMYIQTIVTEPRLLQYNEFKAQMYIPTIVDVLSQFSHYLPPSLGENSSAVIIYSILASYNIKSKYINTSYVD